MDLYLICSVDLTLDFVWLQMSILVNMMIIRVGMLGKPI